MDGKDGEDGKGASADAADDEGDGKPSLSPFAKAFERKRNENAAPDAEKLLRDMAKTKHAADAKQAHQQQQQQQGPDGASSQASDGHLPGSEQKVGKKSDKEIYLETCAKHPTTVGCPTCEEVPTMPHCGLNQSAWQDLTGFPKGADPKSCASVGDVTKEWCVMNCGGTPPNCPSTLCKCKAPVETQQAQQQGQQEQEGEGTAAERLAKALKDRPPRGAAFGEAEPQQQQQQQQQAQSKQTASTEKTEATWLAKAQDKS